MLISRRLLDVAHRLDGLRSGETSAAPPEAPPVPIETLLLEPEPPIVSIDTLAPEEAPPSALELSFRTFESLVREQAPTTPSLDALLRRAGEVAPFEEPAVAIGTLCYTGQAALERANAVRHQIVTQLNRDSNLESLQPLLQELLDLVPLALDQS
jgi:hypothetical protein